MNPSGITRETSSVLPCRAQGKTAKNDPADGAVADGVTGLVMTGLREHPWRFLQGQSGAASRAYSITPAGVIAWGCPVRNACSFLVPLTILSMPLSWIRCGTDGSLEPGSVTATITLPGNYRREAAAACPAPRLSAPRSPSDPHPGLQKRVRRPLLADGGLRPVTGNHPRCIGQRQQAIVQ